MDKLIFLSNELINPEVQEELRIPLKFISFGITEGRMYRHFRNQSNFIIPVDTLKRWGNEVIYGGLFLRKDFNFYARLLDAYHLCSLDRLKRNHDLDVHHRVEVDVTPIYFNTIDELARLKYREGTSIKAQTYMGNLKHNKITQRLNKTVSYRIIDGIDIHNFKKLFEENKL